MGKSADIIPKTAVDYLLGHYPARVVITGASWQSLVKTVVPNLRRCVNELRIRCPGIFKPMGAYEWQPLGKDYDLSLEIVSTLAPERIQGRHCANTLVIVDEASGLAPEIAIAIDSFTQSPTSRQVYSGNPLCDSGPFFDSHHRNRDAPWHCVVLDAADSPNVKEGRMIVSGMATREFVEAKAREWGEESPEFQARVRARFPEEGSLTVISRSMIETAAARPMPEPRGPIIVGLDIARSAKGDYTVFVARDDTGVRAWEHHRGWDRDQIEGRLKAMIAEVKAERVYIDDGGLVGLADSMRNAGYSSVHGVMAGSAPHNPEAFLNARAEMLWGARLALQGGLALPPDLARCLADEAGIQRKYLRAGRMQIESKDEIKERIGRSTDHLDALALTCVEPPGELVFSAQEPALASLRLPAAPILSAAPRHPMEDHDETAARWLIRVSGQPDRFNREGALWRAIWWSRRGPSAAIWAHADPKSNVIVFDAIEVAGACAAGDFGRMIGKRSTAAGERGMAVPHTYSGGDLASGPTDVDPAGSSYAPPWALLAQGIEEGVNEAAPAFKALGWRPASANRAAPEEPDPWADEPSREEPERRLVGLPRWIDGTALDGGMGLDWIDERMRTTAARKPPFLGIWPEGLIAAMGQARFKPDTARSGEASEDAQAGGGALVRCLRLLAVQWAAR